MDFQCNEQNIYMLNHCAISTPEQLTETSVLACTCWVIDLVDPLQTVGC